MQGIYKLLNKAENENTFYFELCSGYIIFAHNFVVKGTKTRFHLLQYLISI